MNRVPVGCGRRRRAPAAGAGPRDQARAPVRPGAVRPGNGVPAPASTPLRSARHRPARIGRRPRTDDAHCAPRRADLSVSPPAGGTAARLQRGIDDGRNVLPPARRLRRSTAGCRRSFRTRRCLRRSAPMPVAPAAPARRARAGAVGASLDNVATLPHVAAPTAFRAADPCRRSSRPTPDADPRQPRRRRSRLPRRPRSPLHRPVHRECASPRGTPPTGDLTTGRTRG